MADISKITLLDGQEYDIKDAVARAAIPAAATATPQMDGSAAVGTSTKYAKEDHVHPTDTSLISLELTGTELVDGDNLNTIKTPGNYYFTGSGTIKGAPTTSKFKMIVIKTGVSEFGTDIGTPCQILFSNEGSNSLYGTIYYRYHNNGNFWRDWQSIRNPSTVNSHTVLSDVPANAVFTDTTYTPASNAPLMDGTAAVGTSEKYAREDHVHPTDNSFISLGLTGTELVDGDSLALIKTQGNYYFNGSGTISDAPTSSKFKMVVIKTGNDTNGLNIGLPCQILFADEGASSKIYYRYYWSGNLWRDWQTLSNNLSKGSRTAIPSTGADLNDYKTPGSYSFASNGSVANSPLPESSYAFTLFVIEGNNTYGHGCSQVIFPIDATVGATFTADVYVRRYSPNASNGGWSDWVNLSSPTTVNGHTVLSDVPANAVFTDTTYTPASATPLMDGTAAVGTSVKYAREDHVHPKNYSMFSLDADGVSLSANNNLDDFKIPGNYYCISASIAEAIVNSPPDKEPFKLVVIRTGPQTSYVCQLAFTRKSDCIYYRFYKSTWSDWKMFNIEPASAAPLMDGTAAVGASEKYAREDHIHPIDSNTFTLIPAGSEIALNSDLNDIDTPGSYFINNTGDTSTINNTPSQAGSNPGVFKLVVLKCSRLNTVNGLIYQFFFSGDASGGTVYMRSRSTAQVWTEWVCLTEPSKINGHTVESDVPANAIFTDTISSGYCTTASDVAQKQVDLTNIVARAGSLFEVLFTNENTYAGKVYLKMNNISQELYLNGIITSSTNYSFPAGKYLVYYSGIAYYIRTDSVFPIKESFITTCESDGSSQDKTLILSEEYTNFYKGGSNYDFFIFVRFINANSYSGPLKLKLQYRTSATVPQLYINGEISSATNCTIPAGIYPLRISNTNHCDLRTDHRLPVSIIGDATTVNGHTVESDVPANAIFTDTTNLASMTGTLSPEHGGTGNTTAKDAANDFINALDLGNTPPTDSDYFISQFAEGNGDRSSHVNANKYYRRAFSYLWSYISSKISSILGLTATSYNGTASALTVNDIADETDLNTLLTPGMYRCGQNTTARSLDNCPVTFAFAMQIVSTVPGTYNGICQMLVTYNNGGKYYHRVHYNGTWSEWSEWKYASAMDSVNGLYYGECDTAAATVAKTVTLTSGNGFALVEGAKICIRFVNANSASNPTLNVNDTGAKPIVRFGTTVIGTTAGGTGCWSAGGIVLFVYDGTSWVEHYWNNTTYSSMTVAEYTAGTATTGRLMTAARLKAAIKLHSAPDVYTATIPTTGWTTASYGAYIDVTFTGATFAADDTVFVDLNLSDDTNLQLINDTWACLLRATPTASSAIIRFKFREIPTVAIPVRAVVT